MEWGIVLVGATTRDNIDALASETMLLPETTPAGKNPGPRVEVTATPGGGNMANDRGLHFAVSR